MNRARLTIDPAFQIGAADRRLFGSFVEHMGRCVYGGIFEPGHPNADESGLRRDVLALIRELGVTVIRYPGGNFVSGYRWEDGIGPVAQRPRRLDLAWKSIETNAFGLDEFMGWTRLAGVEPMLAVNLGTRGIQEACDLLEYANHPDATTWSELRRTNGADKPYGVHLWCLGNELDGPWQVGHRSAAEYGRLAAETARAMKRLDPSIGLVASGSSNRRMPTFGSWEATVLEHCYEQVDYLSLHQYYDPSDGDRASLLASGFDMEAFIKEVISTADHVAARQRHKRRLKLAFDEWNVWYETRLQADLDGRGWAVAPALIEDTYTADDAVVVGDLLITLLRNADRVGIACQAQLVNVIAPIRTTTGGPAWRQTIFHPFALTSRHATGQVLRIEPTGPEYDTAKYGEVPVLSAVALLDGESVTLFAVNRDAPALELTIDMRAIPAQPIEHLVIEGGAATNTETQEQVVPSILPLPLVERGRASVRLPGVSWNMIRFTLRRPT